MLNVNFWQATDNISALVVTIINKLSQIRDKYEQYEHKLIKEQECFCPFVRNMG